MRSIFCHTKSVAMMPKSCAHMRTMSLLGVAAKWPARSLKMKLIVCLAPETYKDTAISVWAYQAGFWKSTRTLYPQQNCENWQYRLVSKPFSSPQMIMYWSAFCIAMGWLKCLVWSIFVLFFTLLLDQPWLIHDRTSVKLNFTFFCVPQ